jgi:hypothetical protein
MNLKVFECGYDVMEVLLVAGYWLLVTLLVALSLTVVFREEVRPLDV